MKKIICEIADNGGVILITDMNDGQTPNQFSAFTTASEAKSSFCSTLDALTCSGRTVAAVPIEQAAPVEQVAPAPVVTIEGAPEPTPEPTAQP